MPALPSGTVSFLYTDIEGSTRLWQQAPAVMPAAMERHNAVLRNAIESNGGAVFRTVGDAFCAVFPQAGGALAAALTAQRALLHEAWPEGCEIRVRMAVHSGPADVQDGDYVGHTLNRVARLLSAAHGGQTLVSAATREMLLGQLPLDVDLRDLGEHRLKDLSYPEHIYQLSAPELRVDFPAVKSLETRPTNLPVQPTPFIGRKREIEMLARVVREPGVRLLTLTGPGGTGKTRLALQLGAEVLDDYSGGVYVVVLEDVFDASRVPYAIAQVLGIKEEPNQDPLEAVISFLGNREILLILDNFEQVVSAAPTVSRLLAHSPGLTILVTSRTVLRLSGEHEFAVPALELPDTERLPALENLSQYDAVALFIERARGVKSDFAVTNETAPSVAEICVRLDGLPLAIELAAARIRLFPPRALLARLERRLSLLTGGARDLPARQQTLRGAIDWSYSLLDPDEQRLFARLSVFAGGCTFDAVENVCNVDGDLHIDPLEGIESLVEKSLLRRVDASVEPRFIMLETIREYAADRLVERGEAETIQERHFKYFVDIAGRAYAVVSGGTEATFPMDDLAPENDNFIAAVRWISERGDAPKAMRLVGYLEWFWNSRGLWHDADTWGRVALGCATDDQFPAERGLLLFGTGMQLCTSGDMQAGPARLLRAHELLARAGDERSSIQALCFAGMFMSASGETARGVEHLHRAMELAQATEDTRALQLALMALARASLQDGDFAAARQYASRAVGLRNAAHFADVHAANMLGDIARCEGLFAEARDHYQQALNLSTASGQYGIVPSHRHNVAWASHDLGDDTRAMELFLESIQQFRAMSDDRGVAECLIGLGCAVAEPAVAVRLFAAGFALLERAHRGLSPPNQSDYHREAARIREQIGDQAWERAWQEGVELSPEEALSLLPAQPTIV